MLYQCERKDGGEYLRGVCSGRPFAWTPAIGSAECFCGVPGKTVDREQYYGGHHGPQVFGSSYFGGGFDCGCDAFVDCRFDFGQRAEFRAAEERVAVGSEG